MTSFWIVFWGALGAFAALAVLLTLAFRPLVRALLDAAVDCVMRRMLRSPYSENLFGVVSAMRHAGPQTFVETLLRASSQGRSISRPLGSPLHPSPWEQLLLQPVYLRPRLPTPEDVTIETRVVLGPKARRPLAVDIPILITGMSYGGALSVEAKLALAKAANLVGTATNSGESYLPEERQAAERLILQHHRGLWPHSTMNRPELLKHGDAIEIQLGQGAQAAAAMKTRPSGVGERMQAVYGLAPGEQAALATRFRGVDAPADFVAMVRQLKQELEVPVGVKIGVSDYLEQDLEVFCEAGVDFVTVDGAEGGTHGGPPTLQDDVGLPTLHGIVRADDYLRRVGRRQDVSLIAAGQLTTPGRFLKAMALGADAVYVGTVALIALLSDQMAKALPGEPPFDLVLQSASARWNRKLDVERAAERLASYLRSCMADITYTVQALGKRSLAAVDRDDLVALDPDVADLCGVRLAWRRRTDDGEGGGDGRVTADRRQGVAVG